jgi:hypothetical protein
MCPLVLAISNHLKFLMVLFKAFFRPAHKLDNAIDVTFREAFRVISFNW